MSRWRCIQPSQADSSGTREHRSYYISQAWPPARLGSPARPVVCSCTQRGLGSASSLRYFWLSQVLHWYSGGGGKRSASASCSGCGACGRSTAGAWGLGAGSREGTLVTVGGGVASLGYNKGD